VSAGAFGAPQARTVCRGARSIIGAPLAAPGSGSKSRAVFDATTAKVRTEGCVTENPQDRARLIEEIVEVIAAEGMVDRDRITPDASIESLDLKSVDIVMILTALEEKFNVYIPMDGSLQEAKDVKSLLDAIADHIQKEREKQ
jgi:acyl carrier protein